MPQIQSPRTWKPEFFSAAWPLLAAVLAMGAFSNPFAVGPALAILLISSGVLASQPLSGAGGPAARTGAGAVPTGPGST